MKKTKDYIVSQSQFSSTWNEFCQRVGGSLSYNRLLLKKHNIYSIVSENIRQNKRGHKKCPNVISQNKPG